jgi:hypothetical protein
MTYATGAQHTIMYVAETVDGTTPGTPQMIEIPKRSSTLGLKKEIINDPTITSDRQEWFERHGNYQVNGNLVSSFAHHQFDDFIEALLGGTWATNAVKVGTTKRSFTIERGYTDIAQYERYTGCKMNSWELAIANSGSTISSTFGVIGKSMTTGTSPLDATPTAVLGNQPMFHVGSTITVGGSSVKVTAFNLSVTNNIAVEYAIGSASAENVAPLTCSVTGSMVFFRDDLTMFNRFLNETSAEVVTTLTDGTNTYTITMGNVKFNSSDIPLSGSGTLFETVNFKALRDSGDASPIIVARSS